MQYISEFTFVFIGFTFLMLGISDWIVHKEIHIPKYASAKISLNNSMKNSMVSIISYVYSGAQISFFFILLQYMEWGRKSL